MTDHVSDRIDRLLRTIPGPALSELLDWLGEIDSKQGYGTFVFTAERGAVEYATKEVRSKFYSSKTG